MGALMRSPPEFFPLSTSPQPALPRPWPRISSHNPRLFSICPKRRFQSAWSVILLERLRLVVPYWNRQRNIASSRRNAVVLPAAKLRHSSAYALYCETSSMTHASNDRNPDDADANPANRTLEQYGRRVQRSGNSAQPLNAPIPPRCVRPIKPCTRRRG
jgi:hypothetical protein